MNPNDFNSFYEEFYSKQVLTGNKEVDILRDWGRHVSESSGKLFFLNLIERIRIALENKGLYVSTKDKGDNVVLFIVSYDRPGSKDHHFYLKNEDNKHYSWERAYATRTHFY